MSNNKVDTSKMTLKEKANYHRNAANKAAKDGDFVGATNHTTAYNKVRKQQGRFMSKPENERKAIVANIKKR